jgi:hypothetical protein
MSAVKFVHTVHFQHNCQQKISFVYGKIHIKYHRIFPVHVGTSPYNYSYVTISCLFAIKPLFKSVLFVLSTVKSTKVNNETEVTLQMFLQRFHSEIVSNTNIQIGSISRDFYMDF